MDLHFSLPLVVGFPLATMCENEVALAGDDLEVTAELVFLPGFPHPFIAILSGPLW